MTITHLITAALAIVVHSINVAASASEFADGPSPNSTEKYVYASAVDPRNGRIRPPYCDPNVYVFNTTGVHIFDIPVSLFDESQIQNEDQIQRGRSGDVVFWRIARRIKESYDDLKTKKGLIGNGHLWLSKFVEMAKKQGTTSIEGENTPPPKPQTCPYFVSDPPGSLQLQPSYPLALPKISTPTSTPLHQTLTLGSFQLCSSDNWAKVGARSHSWNGLLTLALNFNYVRNPREEMHRLLEEWKGVLERVVRGAGQS